MDVPPRSDLGFLFQRRGRLLLNAVASSASKERGLKLARRVHGDDRDAIALPQRTSRPGRSSGAGCKGPHCLVQDRSTFAAEIRTKSLHQTAS